MSTRLRVGLVGTGFIGSVHARSIHAAGADLVGVAASDPQRSQEAAHRLGARRAFASALDLVTDDGVDVVHITTPNDLHHPLALAALEAGKHVVCEKPLALSAADAAELRAAADARGLVGAVPFVNRFHPMAREARDQLLRGDHGSVHTIHGSYLQDWLLDPRGTNWRVASDRGGPSRAFADIGSHWCDLAEWLTGDRLTEVSATTSTVVAERPVGGGATFSGRSDLHGAPLVADTGAVDTEIADTGAADTGAVDPEIADTGAVDTEDVACLVFRTAGGATGALTVSQVAAGRKNRLWIEIDATRHSVAFNQEEPEQLRVGAQRGADLLARDPGGLSAGSRPYAVLPAGHVQGFHDCFDAFVRDVYRTVGSGVVVEGLPTFADGERSARIVEAVLASADKHAWIEV